MTTKVSIDSVIFIEEYAKGLLLSEDEIGLPQDQDYQDDDQPGDISITLSEDNKQTSNEFSKNTITKFTKPIKQNRLLQMRKAGVGSGDSKKYGQAPTLTQSKSINVKLSSELLSKLDSMVIHPPSDDKIPSSSYLEGISELHNINHEDTDAIQNYLEMKYLSQEFRFHTIQQQNAKSAYSPHLRFESIVNNILSRYHIDYKWYFYMHSFIDKIMKTVRPNPNRPNAVVNYIDYVTVKTVQWKDHLKCEYIPGMVLENNVADRRMKTNILNPRIVLVEGSLTFDFTKRSFLDIDSIMKQEKHFLKNVEKSILSSKPEVMVIEGDVSRKIVERIRDLGCTIIMNVDIDEIKRLAWMTQTIIVPSVEFLDETFKVGTCEEFIVQPQLDYNTYSKSTSHYFTKYNVFFRG